MLPIAKFSICLLILSFPVAELEIHFNGVVPASERRQIYSIAVYIFLPPGVESKETDRPFSHIWTSTKLHTPRVAIEHLCTHFAPVMLGGLFNASLQVKSDILSAWLDFKAKV